MALPARQTDHSLVPWDHVISVVDAAPRLGYSDAGSFKRAVGIRELESRRLAWFARHPTGGQPQWWVHRSYDDRLHDGPIKVARRNADAEADQRATENQRDAAQRKAQIAEAFAAARQRETAPLDQWIGPFIEAQSAKHPVKISQRSLYRWGNKIDWKAHNWRRLISKAGGDRRSAPDPSAIQFFKDLVFSEKKIKIKSAWRTTSQEAQLRKWEWFTSYDQCRRWYKATFSEFDALKARDPKTWQQRMRARQELDPDTWSPGELWIGDHAQLDMICYVINSRGKREYFRPWITAWLDWKSRRIMGYQLCRSPNSTAILAAFKKGVTDPNLISLPAAIAIDNGKDYRAKMFHNARRTQYEKTWTARLNKPKTIAIFDELKIHVHFSIPHNPNGKSRVERWFGTLHEHFDKMYATYCGGTQDARPTYLNELIKEGRVVPHFDDVAEHLDEHIRGYNAWSDHDRQDVLGQSPDDVLATCMARRVVDDPETLQTMLMVHHKPTKVKENGVSIRFNGKPYHYGKWERALDRFKAVKGEDRPDVYVAYDPDDMKYVRVFDEKLREICVAKANDLVGVRHDDKIGREQLREAMKMQRRQAKLSKEVVANRRVSMQSTFAVAAQLNDPPPPEPNPNANFVPLQTRFKRRAAGAESYDDEMLDLGNDVIGRACDEYDDAPIELNDPAVFAGHDDDQDMEVLELDNGDAYDPDVDDEPLILDDLDDA